MKQDITIPEVSEGVKAGTVISLNVAVGDQVESDQTLIELETDKAVVAIPSPEAGTISEILIAEGDTVEIGATIMRLEASTGSKPRPEKTQPPEKSSPEPASTKPEPEPRPQATELAGEPAPSPAPASQKPKTEVDLTSVRRGNQVAPAAPSVRRLARELGTDIYQVQGSGPGGRISEDDVRNYVRDTMQRFTGSGGNASEFPGLHAQRQLPDFSRYGEVNREPLSKIREVTADAMSYAWSTIPMVTQYDKADIGQIEAFRKSSNEGSKADDKLTTTAFLVKVCTLALQAFPAFNSAIDLASRELVLMQYFNIGVAVDTPNGLLVPVIRETDQKGIGQIARELNDMAARTRERRVKPDELEGGTFTISNLGGIGGTAFTPIVYAPQVAILGVSTAEIRPVWNGSEFQPRLVMPLSLSYDHRVIDGAAGARFLRWICEALEQPLKLLM